MKNHELMRDARAASGNLDSPVRQDMEDAARMAGLDFILNVVQNSQKEIVRAVAGDFVQAHRAGATVVDRMYRRDVQPAEIVVTCAGGRPKDLNLFQAQKALDNAKNAAARAVRSSWWRNAVRAWAIRSSSAGPVRPALQRTAGSASAGSTSSEGIKQRSWLRNQCSIN